MEDIWNGSAAAPAQADGEPQARGEPAANGEPRDAQETRKAQGTQRAQEAQGARTTREMRDAQAARGGQEAQGAQEAREAQSIREAPAAQAVRDAHRTPALPGAQAPWQAPAPGEAQNAWGPQSAQAENASPAGRPQTGRESGFAEQLRRYQQREMQAVFDGDLKAIRSAYPDERANSVDELGPQFIAMCAAGVSPLSAYEALRAEKARSVRQPPSMGDVRPAGGKGFYTRDEVARMSRSEIERNFERIRRSMDRW